MSATVLTAQTQPTELTWAVGEFAGDSDWAVRLPQLLVRGWEPWTNHTLSEAETRALRDKFLSDALKATRQQQAQLTLDLDRRRLFGPLAAGEPAATLKTLASLEVKAADALAGRTPGAAPPSRLPVRALWSTTEALPWAARDPGALAAVSKAAYLFSGTVKAVGDYLSVRITLTSAWEKRVLASWQGSLAPEEAPEQMVAAADAFRAVLLGRPWAGLVVKGAAGTAIRALGQRHLVPWAASDLAPGDLSLEVLAPGQSPESRSVSLIEGQRVTLDLPAPAAGPPLVLDTSPPGAALYLDSRYLGTSPQTVARPLETSRVRAELEGFASSAWEVGPGTASPSWIALTLAAKAPDVPGAKDAFYLTLAAFSASLTTAAFTGAWTGEQVALANSYAAAGVLAGYNSAVDRYRWVAASYGASVVLTTGVFVWMMFALGDYLGSAQATLP